MTWFMDVRGCQIAVNHDMVHKITINVDIYTKLDVDSCGAI